MSFSDQPRRQRQPRYPALIQQRDGYSPYPDSGAENGYQEGYPGFAGLADARQQRPPWEQQQRQQTVRETGAQPSIWETGPQRSVRTTGAQPTVRTTGARTTGGQRAARDGGLVRGGQELPRRASGALPAVTGEDYQRPRGHSHSRDRRSRDSRGLLAGGLAGFLAAGLALGVANLVAAFVRPQASPIIAVGEAFIDRTPPALKNFAVQKFGENDKNMLLLGMYVTIALIAVAIGMLAWRRVSIGVAGIGLFGLFGAFVALTRPESHITDVIPSVVGGIAGIVAIIGLTWAGLPRTRGLGTRKVASHGSA